MPYQLAELNIASMMFGYDDPRMQDFTDNLDRVNAAADASDGFVWRFSEEPKDEALINELFGKLMLVNMSVWQDASALRKFMSSKPHIPIMKRRAEWFRKMDTPHLVLWWVKEGHTPTLEEARARLDHLMKLGPSQYAFSFFDMFNAPTAKVMA